MPSLRISDVTRDFADTSGPAALQGVSLSIRHGEFVAIQGPSGGGKSTLLNILGLLDTPTSGEYRVGEASTRQMSSDELARLRSDTFAFVFQSFHLLDHRPVIDSVELGLLYRGVSTTVRRRLAREALVRVGLAQLSERPANTLSGGERQRVAIARALTTGAPVLLADEPTGNLDTANGEVIERCLVDLHRGGATVVLVTHEDRIARLAERRLQIVDGVLEPSSVPTSRARPLAKVSRDDRPPGRSSHLRIRDLLVDALRSIRSRKGRTGALASAVALGVALAVATAGVSMSARSQVSDAFDAHLNRDVTVRWYSEDAIDNQLRTDSELLVALDSLSGVGAVALLDDLGGHSIQASSVRSTYTTRVFAGQGDLTQAARAEVTWAVNHDQTLQPGEALVGEQLASTLSLGPIDMRPTIAIDGIPVAVVGVIIDSPRLPEMSGAVVVAADGSRSNERESRTALLLTMPGGAQQVARQAPLVVNPYSPLSLEVNAPIDPAELRDEIEGHVRTTLIIVTVVALLGAIAGLANAMLLSVGERKQEIGLRRAVGAKAAHVSRLIATESTIIGFLGGILGLAVGLVAVLATTIAQSWIPVFDLRLAPVAIVGGIAVGSLAGLFAAVRAGQIRPHLALRL